MEPLRSYAWQSQIFFGKTLFAPKLGKWAKNRVFWIKKYVVINFHWICALMKIYIICCVPAQILCLEIVLINQIAGFLNQLFLQNKSIKQPHFLHVDIDSQKLNVNRKCFSWAWSKMGVASLVCGLNLNISQEWTDGRNWFSVFCYKFRKSKSWFNDFWVGVVKNGHGLLVHETRN